MGLKRLITIFLAASFVSLALVPYSQAQKAPRGLTLIYSNNINGEIDSCFT